MSDGLYVNHREFAQHQIETLQGLAELREKQAVLDARVASIPQQLADIKTMITELKASSFSQAETGDGKRTVMGELALALHNLADSQQGRRPLLERVVNVAGIVAITLVLGHLFRVVDLGVVMEGAR